jgi:hypothetical protein
MARPLPMLRVHPSDLRARLRRTVRVNFAQIAGRDDEEAATRYIPARHLPCLEQLDDGENPAVPRKADAITDLERCVLLALVKTAQEIDKPPGQTLLNDLVPPRAQAFAKAAQRKINGAIHGRYRTAYSGLHDTNSAQRAIVPGSVRFWTIAALWGRILVAPLYRKPVPLFRKHSGPGRRV